VLVHGAGDTAAVWDHVVDGLAAAGHRALAVDLIGRRSRPFDLTRVTLAGAADVAAADIAACDPGPTLLVGHSAGGMVLPFLVGRLAERSVGVVRLVFVAGLVAPEGGRVIDLVAPETVDRMEERRRELLERHRGQVLGPAADGPAADGLIPLGDHRVAQGLESLNLMFQRIAWAGVPDGLPRTFVRCLRDRIQPRDVQARLAAAGGATEVIDLDGGHTPARGHPAELAALLADLAERAGST
jgi:pimeloyl-ACP methyl ester carboxylesterase